MLKSFSLSALQRAIVAVLFVGLSPLASLAITPANGSATITSATGSSLTEGNSGAPPRATITVTLSEATTFPVVLSLTPSGTATFGNKSGSDFFLTSLPPSSVSISGANLVFNANTSVNINLTVVGDVYPEPNETAKLTLSAVTPDVTITGTNFRTYTIVNDDVATYGSLSFADMPEIPVTEGNGANVSFALPINVTLSGATIFPVVAKINHVSTGSYCNSNGCDYWFNGLSTTQTLTFTNNGTKSFSVAILNDNKVEGDETIDLTLTSLTAPIAFAFINHTITISDDDAPRLGGDADLNASAISLYPNPTNGAFKLDLVSPVAATASYDVIDMTGRTIQTGVQSLVEGANSVDFDVTGVTPGIYFLQFQAGDRIERMKFVVR